jgi:DEAD/DEAH box helicase domain-containing protein
VDYYTQPVVEQHLLWRDLRESREMPGAGAALGDASVTWFTSFFKKIRFQSVDSIGWGNLDLPKQTIETVSFSLAPDAGIRAMLKAAGKNPTDGLAGLRNLFISVLPLWAMCDRSDIGGVVDSRNLGKPAVFLYDRFPGGLGFVEHAFRHTHDVLAAARSLVEECPCETGCPSCVGLPMLRPAQHQDPEVGGAWPIPDKEAARLLLHALLSRADDAAAADARRGVAVEHAS